MPDFPLNKNSPKKLAEISKFIKLKNIKYLFFEPLFPSNLAETVSKETGADILALNPLEGLTKEDLELGKDYIKIMKDNLVNLKKLQCR